MAEARGERESAERGWGGGEGTVGEEDEDGVRMLCWEGGRGGEEGKREGEISVRPCFSRR